MTDTFPCVYCTERKPADKFNREHVVAKNLAPSIQNNLTLPPAIQPAVCKDCNTHFGQTLDDAIGHDSLEALQRFRFGAKPLRKLKDQPRTRVRLRLPTKTEFGRPKLVCRVEPADSRHSLPLAVHPVPQAVFPLTQGGWLCMTEDELLVSYPRSDPRLDADVVYVFAVEEFDGPDVFDRLENILRMKGLELGDRTPIQRLPERGEVIVEQQVVIDATIARSVAKFAFNCLTYQAGPRYALRPEFDEVRKFVRYGDGDWKHFVKVPEPGAEARERRRCPKHCHLVQLEQANVGEIRWPMISPVLTGYVGAVTLFGEVVYLVRLSRSIPGLWRRIEGGYQYNLSQQAVRALPGTPSPFYIAA